MPVVRLALKYHIFIGVPAFSEQQYIQYRKNYNITVGIKMIGCEDVMDDKGWKNIQKNSWTSPKIEQRDIYFA
jgi:hypothetical protein